MIRLKSTLLGGVAVGVMLSIGFGGAADAKTSKKHVRHTADASPSNEKLDALAAEVEALKARLEDEEQGRARVEAQAQAAQSQATQAQAEAQAAHAQLAEQIQTLPGQVTSAVAAIKPKTDKIYYKGVSVTLGGFAAAESVTRSHDETADIGSSYAKMPFANDKAGHTSSTTFTGRQSRYSALVQGDVTPAIHASFYGEFDFLGAAQTANSTESNSYTPRVRNLYGALDWDEGGWHLLAGQNWSLATMSSKGITPRNETPPPTIDSQYVPGFVWTRQPQVRLTKDFNKKLWLAVSLENPQTTIGGNTTPATGVTITTTQSATSQYNSANSYSLNNIPDVIGKVAYEDTVAGHSLHAELFGIYRSYMDRVSAAPSGTNGAALLNLTAGNTTATSSGGGVGGGVAVNVIPKLLDIQGSALGGSGIGRYGTSQLSDVTVRPDGHLAGISEVLWMAGGTLHATPMLDVYVFGGKESEHSKTYRTPGGAAVSYGYGTLTGSNNAGCAVEGGTCNAVIKSIDQITVGAWDKIYTGSFGRVQIGLQYSYTEKKAFADATAAAFAPKATENMILTSFRYYPF